MSLPAPQKILIIEPLTTGHHLLLYVRYLLPEILKRSHRDVVLLTSNTAFELPELKDLFQSLQPRLTVECLDPPNSISILPPPLKLIQNQFAWWVAIKKAGRTLTRQHPIDCVYFPTVDFIEKAIALLGSPVPNVRFSTLLMSPKHHRFAEGLGPRSRSDAIYSLLFTRLLKNKNLARMLVIDKPFYHNTLKSAAPQWAKDKMRYAPDFGDAPLRMDRAAARKRIGISDNTHALLVYGSLTQRKGIRQLLSALSLLSAERAITLIFAGNPSPDVRAMIVEASTTTSPHKSIISRLFTHDRKQQGLVFAAADSVWLAYPNFWGSSGVLFQASHAHLPVIGTEHGLIGRTIQEYQLGRTCDPHNVHNIACRLASTIDGDHAAPKLSEFLAKHSAAAHTAAVTSSIFETLPSD